MIYGTWTIEEAKTIGKTFKAKCKSSHGYNITIGNIYEVTITSRILPMSPLCSFIDDNGKFCEGYLEMFEKVTE